MGRVWAVAAALIVGIAGCGPVDEGTAFADEFESVLDGREKVADYSVDGYNTLPWSGDADVRVTLVAGLADEQIAREVWEITHQDVDPWVEYDLVVEFPAASGDGQAATAAFRLGVSRPAPDTDEAREEVERRAFVARSIVAQGRGETTMWIDTFSRQVTSERDPAEFAAALCAADLGEGYTDLTVSSSDEARPSGRVEFADADSCDDLAGPAALLDAARQVGELADYSISLPEGTREHPAVSVSFVTPPVSTDALRDLADSLDIDLTVA
ncbi:MAG: hypothetical protein QM597_03860 [Aeromicrobium sp.]|uniref:hypothetical protein n=1 Tax=Aeromicrobium sp. TaxID=1871063 RepID=UPI0039E2F40D